MQFTTYIAGMIKNNKYIMSIERLHKKVRAFASMRTISTIQAYKIITRAGADLIPKNLKPYHIVSNLNVKESYLVDSVTARIELEDGRVFFGYPSNSRESGLYHLFRDIVSHNLKADTYGLAIEIVRRYLSLEPKKEYPGKGGIMVDAGAYIGLKAMHYADIVGNEGKVIAIEVDLNNYKHLQKNVEYNKLPVIPVNCGISSTRSRVACHHRERQRNLLIPVDGLNETTGYHSQTIVETDSLDNILDKAGVQEVDYLNIQVNGAELDVLKGLTLDRVKTIWIASYYSVNNEPNAPKVKKHLMENNFKIIYETEAGGILAKNSSFV